VFPTGLPLDPVRRRRRRCLGAAFASFEMKAILRTVLQSLELEPARDRLERRKMRDITVVPATATRVWVSAG
jgi:cytochrome P450 family 138